MDEVERIAAHLTIKQRECFDWACSFLPVPAPSEGDGIEQFCDDCEPTDTINQCFDLGIMREIGPGWGDDFHIIVTDLGLRVRNHLGDTNG